MQAQHAHQAVRSVPRDGNLVAASSTSDFWTCMLHADIRMMTVHQNILLVAVGKLYISRIY